MHAELKATWSTLDIETPENIQIHYALAGPGTRMAAYVLDFIFLSVFLGALFLVMALIGEEVRWLGRRLELVTLYMVSIVYGLSGYFIFLEWLLNGQTPGKRMLGIRVRLLDGTPVPLSATIARNIFRFADCAFPFQYAAGCLCLVFTEKTQRVGDLVAGTMVIKESKSAPAPKFRWRKINTKVNTGSIPILDREAFDFFMDYIEIHTQISQRKRSTLSMKILIPILEKTDLSLEPELKRLVDELAELPSEKKFQKAEPIMRELLKIYANA